VSVVEVHDVLETLLADRREVLGWLQLSLRHNEVQHHLLLVLPHELALVDGVDCVREAIPME
jgi:hypothetical protein